MMKKNIFFILSFSLILTIISCTKHDTYPLEPQLEFYSFTKIPNGTNIDDKAILNLSFTDGDGDIGLDIQDTFPPFNYNGDYYFNCVIEYFEKQQDSFVKVDLPLTLNTRIPRVNADVADRGIRGNIEVEVFMNNVLSPYDTIKFRTYIYDRALNKSNVVETPPIYVDKDASQ